eukprot:scaffold114447_cov30-Phaeocystis_antarctica.AAC.1
MIATMGLRVKAQTPEAQRMARKSFRLPLWSECGAVPSSAGHMPTRHRLTEVVAAVRARSPAES